MDYSELLPPMPGEKGRHLIERFGKILIGEEFNLDDPRRLKIYEDVFWYLAGNDRTTLDLNKSLMLIGDLGVGKSVMMRVLNLIFKSFKLVSAKRHVERIFKEFGEVAALREYGYDLKMDLLIDDVGAEEPEAKEFGNKVNIMGSIFLERYDLLKQEGYRTHVITNLMTDKLEERYKDRNFDRFAGSYNMIVWEGASLRIKPNL